MRANTIAKETTVKLNDITVIWENPRYTTGCSVKIMKNDFHVDRIDFGYSHY